MKPVIKIDNGILNLNVKFDNIDNVNIDNIREVSESKLHFIITYDVYGGYSDEVYINHFFIGKYEMTGDEIKAFRDWCVGKFDIIIKQERIG